MKNRLSSLTLALLLLFAGSFLIRVWGLSHIHRWDEMVYLQNAKVICCGKTNYSELDFRPPLISLLFAGVFLIKDHMFAACILTATLNALGPVFLFLAGRRIVGALPSALASLLLGFGPFFVGAFPSGFDSDDTGNSLMTDSPALTLLLLGLWLLLRALEKPRPLRFMIAGFALSMAILMRFGSMPSAGLLCLLPLIAKDRWKALTGTAFGIMVGLGPYLLWSRVTYGGYFATIRQAWANVEGPEQPFTFFVTNAPTIFTWIGMVGLLLAAGAGLAHLFKTLRRGQLRVAHFTSTAGPGLLQAFLWLWLLIDFIFFSRMPHKEPRYILPMAPPVLLLAGLGLALFTRFESRRLRGAGIVVLTAGMVVSLLPSAARFDSPLVMHDRSDEMEASAFLKPLFQSESSVYMNFNYPAIAYFTNYKINVLPIGGPQVYTAIDSIHQGGILIAYRKNESGDPKIELLNLDPNLKVLKEYSTLVIYRHR